MRNKITERYSLDQENLVGYFNIPLTIAVDESLTLCERFVLAHLRLSTILTREPSFDSPREFAAAFNIRESHVKRSYKRLIQKGLVDASIYITPQGEKLGYESVITLRGKR